MTRSGIDTHRRFLILQRDAFTCQFCGSRPGNDRLQVDHVIPSSRGGSDHDNNLTTACDRCNNGKSDRVVVPASLCTDEMDKDGWRIWKRFGRWVISWNPGAPEDDDDEPHNLSAEAALVFDPWPWVWIALDRVHEPDWHDHFRHKPWMVRDRRDRPDSDFHPSNWSDFCEAIAFARTLVTPRGRA